MDNRLLTIFVSGDVMTGRGIDQILPSPSNPVLYESYVKDAREYIRLAEEVNGSIPREVSSDYIWGDALKEWNLRKPEIKLINLETSITSHDTPWENKGIHYRMHPGNIITLQAAGIDVCALANNHVMDWGRDGLIETLKVLHKAGINTSGAGENLDQAQMPAIIPLNERNRCLIFSLGLETSGIPAGWQARANRPGVWLLDDLSSDTVTIIKNTIDYFRKPGDICIVSIHWGGNWGYQIPAEHQDFAHELIDEAGIHLLHGHSSHHPQGIEIYNHMPILYGCGDFFNDYEGISGYEEYKGHLSLMYFLKFDPITLWIKHIELVPMEIKKFSLHYPAIHDFKWMLETMQKSSSPFLTEITLGKRGSNSFEVVIHG
ncbi:CapA family protein [Legionella londiniensis]|uniref:Capsule biosynthesis protein n=1 Tax=Legionella londiniensis TaxID=45068 RepID=A0A0W0VP97_9GAMM|nr:CapA family protein [Legionella londiniensis]KTD21606.1 capsule biosynthesis protein [Legionella londiniensis]STX93377.1 capsule biosynthesis protein [Legionella londiniensis]